ncbi:hypothetical protein HNP12_000618 [Aeromonas hydrophila]|uniref:hypothetical protein n=1 Tax=Aeromonas hydrophila TaxID=644 RepID=UPI002169733A|nr:hypothetical protein [Aeromonas hydrophila]MCS3766570.1 hypothetical protein [Aeromonas hydrophila]
MNHVIANAMVSGSATILQYEDISELESLVMERHGIPKVVSAEVFKEFSDTQRMMLMVKHGLYVFPTIELADWLVAECCWQPVMEIGAGNGALAKHLGIRATDNYSQAPDYRPEPKHQQLWLQGRAAMEQMGQAFVTYGNNVERREAMDAVIKHKPEVVYGLFITHKYRAGDLDGNVFGVDEEKLILRADYIMVGNAYTHRNKRILAQPHEEFQPSGLVTRSHAQELNRIWKWKKTK